MNICAITKSPIIFRGYTERSYIEDKNNPFICEVKNHTTGFWRNLPTLEFTQDYIKENFPQGTQISEFGCSQGQKGYNLMIGLDDFNKDKKYMYHGYDFKKPISDARNGNYKLDYTVEPEKIIFENPSLKSKFFEFFDKSDNPGDSYKMYVKPNRTRIGDIVQLKEGNILDINKIVKPQKSGVVIFQNALYHILSDVMHPMNENKETAKKIFQDIHDILPKNGVFVFGNLPADHMYNEMHERYYSLIYQNGERIRVCKPTIIEKYLLQTGFEPIFYERVPSGTPFLKYNDMHLPSVWKKIRA